MIPVERIRLRTTADAALTVAELQRRVTTHEPSSSAHFKSVRYQCTPGGRCVANSLFRIPYLPVLTIRKVGAAVEVLARPSILEVLVLATVIVVMSLVGWTAVDVILVAVVFHAAGYVCFKLAMGDIRPLFGDLVDDATRNHIGWA
jgi:hypothetical protein